MKAHKNNYLSQLLKSYFWRRSRRIPGKRRLVSIPPRYWKLHLRVCLVLNILEESVQLLYRPAVSKTSRSSLQGLASRYKQEIRLIQCTWTLDGHSAFLRKGKELHCGRTMGEVLRRAHPLKAGNKWVSQKAVPAYVVSNTETIWKRVNSQLSTSARRY